MIYYRAAGITTKSVSISGIAVQLCPGEEVWVEGDFTAGDVLTFPCFTVHKALPSQAPHQIRLSIDARYQAIDEPIEEKSLKSLAISHVRSAQ